MARTTLSNARSALGVLRPARPSLTGLALDLGWLQAEFEADQLELRGLAETTQAVGSRLVGERESARALIDPETRLVGITILEERQVLLGRPGQTTTLKGARLAIANPADQPDRRADALETYLAALDQAGLTIDAVDVLSLPPRRVDQAGRTEAQALIDGEVDLIHASGLEARDLQRRHGFVTILDLGLATVARPVTATADLLAERPDVVARFLAVLLLAADWSIDNAAEVRRRLAGLHQADPADVVEAHGRQFHLGLGVSLAPDLLARLEARQSFLRDWALTPETVDLTSRLERSPLEAAQKLFRRGQVLANLKEAV